MKIEKKRIASTIILILMLSTTLSAVFTPSVNAEIIEYDTYARVMFSPEIVGVGQNVIVSMRIDKMGVGTTIRTNLFTGYTVQITKPDGTIETKGPFTADATSGAWLVYVPSQAGKYQFKFTFPGMWINTTSVQRWYKPSTSDIAELTVQQNPITPYPDVPLPTDYWTRPIYGENKGWWQFADNWLMGTRNRYDPRIAPYTSAPNSPHILWKKPVWFGGIAGGQFQDKVYYTGLSYEQPYLPMILNGRIIYAANGPTSTAIFGTHCLDLYTGEEIWYLDGVNIAFAQTVDIETANEHGILPYLWSTEGSSSNGTWVMYDAFTGKELLTVTNITSSRTMHGPNGEILSYSISGPSSGRRLILWNSTKAIMNDPANPNTRGPEDYFSPKYGSTINGNLGIEWNVSLPNVGVSQSILALNDGYLLARYTNTGANPQIFTDMAYDLSSMKKDSNGNYPATLNNMWLKNRTDLYTPSQRPINIGSGVYCFFSSDTGKVHTYSILTGEQLWESESLPGWGIFDVLSIVAYGKVIYTGYDGHVWAWDAKTGEPEWDFYFGSAGFENAYGTYAVNNGVTAADGKLFVTNDEHTPDSTMWRGGKIAAIDINTGECVWNLSGWIRLPAIADGILTAVNAYDNQIYTIGKGPSKTIIEAPMSGVTAGSVVTIKGTVTDQSPDSKDTPAISDKDMSAWMEYLHMQKPMPIDATGVPVTLTVTFPDDHSEVIGTTTSDIGGSYGLAWTPTAEGTYQIMATFEGTESYGSSYATTYLAVGPASAPIATTPAPSQTTVPTTAAPTTTAPTASPSAGVEPGTGVTTETLLIAGAATVIIIAVLAAALFLRKRQ